METTKEKIRNALTESNVTDNRAKKQLKIMRIFIIAVYLPFFIFLALTHDVKNYSLSNIGWRQGGEIFLIWYVVITVPFMLYQIFFFMRNTDSESRLLVIMSIIGSCFVIAGAFIPFRETDTAFVITLHNICAMMGALICVQVLVIMIAGYFKKNRDRKLMAAFLMLVVFILYIYISISHVALFVTGLPLVCFTILYFFNKKIAVEKVKNS